MKDVILFLVGALFGANIGFVILALMTAGKEKGER